MNYIHLKKKTHGPIDNIPLNDFGLYVRNKEVITHSNKPLSVVIAIKCDANLRLPSRRSNILEKNIN